MIKIEKKMKKKMLLALNNKIIVKQGGQKSENSDSNSNFVVFPLTNFDPKGMISVSKCLINRYNFRPCIRICQKQY